MEKTAKTTKTSPTPYFAGNSLIMLVYCLGAGITMGLIGSFYKILHP
jgi:hypothetical protein